MVKNCCIPVESQWLSTYQEMTVNRDGAMMAQRIYKDRKRFEKLRKKRPRETMRIEKLREKQ